MADAPQNKRQRKENDQEQKRRDRQERREENQEYHQNVQSRHRPHGLTGGIILITIGALFLLNNFGIIPWSIWSDIWRFWPVIFVFIGLDILLGWSWFGAVISSLISAAVIIMLLLYVISGYNQPVRSWMQRQFPWLPNRSNTMMNFRQATATGNFTVEKNSFGTVSNRTINISTGPAKAVINDSDNSYYLKGMVISDVAVPYRLDPQYQDSSLAITFDGTEMGPGMMFQNSRLEYDFSIGSPRTPTDLNINVGVGKGQIDLTKLFVNTLQMNIGVGSADIALKEQSVPLRDSVFKVGVGSGKLKVPGSVGLRINYHIGLGTFRVNNQKFMGNGFYTTSNYESASRRLNLDVNVGTGSMDIVTE